MLESFRFMKNIQGAIREADQGRQRLSNNRKMETQEQLCVKEKMNTLTIPPSPSWYQTSIVACSPDNTLVYGSRNDLVIIENSESQEAAVIRIISRAHSLKILSVNLNKNWGQPNKFAVTVSEDKVVKIWNVETRKKHSSHNEHLGHQKVIGATFAGDERVISVSEDGIIVVWSVSLNQTKLFKDLLGTKVNVTCISTCPHATWLTAFGLKNGLVVVADLRKNGKVLYRLRGHEKSVLSLSWCPVPINIFPKNPMNHIGPKKNSVENKVDSENANLIDEETKESQKTENDIILKPDGSHPLLKVYDSNDEEFLRECQKLRDKISGTEEVTGIDNTQSQSSPKLLKPENFALNDSKEEIETGEEATEDVKNDVMGETKMEEFPEKTDLQEKESEETQKAESVIDTEEYKSVVSEVLNSSNDDDDDTKVCQSIGSPELAEENTNKGTVSHSEVEEKKKTCAEVGREIVSKEAHVEEEEAPRKEFLLASSAKEGNIYIWRAGTDGRMQTFMSIPSKSKNRRAKPSSEKIWITLCWISPTSLLSSSKSSELLLWTLPKLKDQSKNMSVIHKDHTTTLFAIAAPTVFYNESNWSERSNSNVWTVGQDRLLLNTSLTREKTNLASYPTFGGNVPCLELSPLDPNRLAIGTSDGFIKVWDLSRPHTKKIIMTSFYQKIQSKVMSLAWHPENERLLAFGTLEGRVGYLDTTNKSKLAVILQHFFKTQINKIEWAPKNKNIKEFALYVAAEGKLVIFDVGKSEKEPVEIDIPDDTFIYSFSWKSDYSMMLATTKSGYIIVYSSELKIVCKHYFQERLREIFWHPSSTENDSKQGNWFASTTSSKKVIVYDFDVESKDNDSRIVAKYEGLEDVINSISWSPYELNQLVIASEIGVAQVWDVDKNEIVSTITNPNFDGLLRAVWSPVDPDFMICGNKDFTMRIMKISENPPKDKNDIRTVRKTILKELAAESTDTLPKTEPLPEETAKVKRVSKSVLLPNFYTGKNTSQIVADLKKLLMWKEDPQSVERQVGDCGKADILDIFGTNSDMMKLISKNETIQKQRGKYNMNAMLTLFRGDISTSIKEAIQEKRVTPWLISLAPMVSPNLWQTACETYARQLSEEPEADHLEMPLISWLVTKSKRRYIVCARRPCSERHWPWPNVG
ncbi:hypothetical protein JTB14_003835 [Gonioctena quinquepunctata]|nr:hypothetical protein JTB14_003835 [Gonioctena quinquepunctata]